MSLREIFVLSAVLVVAGCCNASVWAQSVPDDALVTIPGETYTILRIDVMGVEDEETQRFLEEASGLRVGQQVSLPGDAVFAVAIRSIYRLEQFSDVEITHRKDEDRNVFVTIRVESYPRLQNLVLKGVGRKDKRALEKRIRLLANTPLRPAEVEHAKRSIINFFEDKGHPNATVKVQQQLEGKHADLLFDINPGARIAVAEVHIEGNEYVSDKALRRQMKTQPRSWWQFWKKATFDAQAYEQDLEQIVSFLNSKGHYDARIISDTVFADTSEGATDLVVHLKIHEGPVYHIRHITFEGNTRFGEAALIDWLGVPPGGRYNSSLLQENLYGNAAGKDIASRYMNQGYMRFQARPSIIAVGDDSLDVHIALFEGDVYNFGTIEVAGNAVTKDHVVRRELYSIPGEPFSRSAIQESMRRLMQTGYFSDASIMRGPEMAVDDEAGEVNLRYEVEETSFPRPQLSGTFSQFGLVMGVGLTYNNFSAQHIGKRGAWRPLPSGDGQTVSLNVQTTGKAYQQYSFAFTEPWFKARPGPLGFSTSYTHIGSDVVSSALDGHFNTFTAQVFRERRLSWPSPFFSMGSVLQYQTYSNTLYDALPQGRNDKVAFTQSITRNTTDHQTFPSRGSRIGLSAEVAAPLEGFIQYHKWKLQGSWNVPLVSNSRLSLNLSSDFGYIGSLTGDAVQFERFVLGGSPLDAQGIASTPILGTDVVYFRGYPLGAFGTADDSGLTGGRVLTKYATELRWMAVRQPQFTIQPYLFFDAANTWSAFDAYKPLDLFRSAGLGVRMNVPMFGLLEVVYGRNLDAYIPPTGSSNTGLPGWGLQFSIGRSFNF